ncbi:MAG: hypothetical protein K8S99_07920 [Planctomycetes bacterium]|nr:hypothetical protein [Planctomycetota bacterium]
MSVYKALAAVCGLYLVTGYFLGHTYFDNNPGDPRYMLLLGLASVLCYCVTTLWLWGNDTMLGVEKSIWAVLPWALILLGFVGFFVVPA